MNCPNCGAPMSYGNQCEYCGTLFSNPLNDVVKENYISFLNRELSRCQCNLANELQTQKIMSTLDYLHNQLMYSPQCIRFPNLNL